MTTNNRVTPKRDKHPARGARIITTGISVVATLGLTSAYAIASQNTAATTAESTPLAPVTQQIAASKVATLAPATAPTLPAAAPQVTFNVPKRHRKAATTSSGSH